MRKNLKHFKPRLKRWVSFWRHDFLSGKQPLSVVFLAQKDKDPRIGFGGLCNAIDAICYQKTLIG